MTAVRRADVERIAALAALAVDDEALPRLTEQIRRILEYVSQLKAVQPDRGVEDQFRASPGPDQPLRTDQVRPADPLIDPTTFAPAFQDGLFLGPSPGLLGEE